MIHPRDPYTDEKTSYLNKPGTDTIYFYTSLDHTGAWWVLARRGDVRGGVGGGGGDTHYALGRCSVRLARKASTGGCVGASVFTTGEGCEENDTTP